MLCNTFTYDIYDYFTDRKNQKLFTILTVFSVCICMVYKSVIHYETNHMKQCRWYIFICSHNNHWLKKRANFKHKAHFHCWNFVLYDETEVRSVQCFVFMYICISKQAYNQMNAHYENGCICARPVYTNT